MTLEEEYNAQQAGQPQGVSTDAPELSLEEQYAQQENDALAEEAAFSANDAITAVHGDAAGFAVDKISRLISGTADMIKGLGVETPKALAYWAASKFFDDDQLDSPEERSALMTGVTAMMQTASPVSKGLDDALTGISEKSGEFIDDHDGKDFVDLAEDGDYLEATDAFLGDISSALPSVGAAFLGPAGLAAIGGSAFGNKFVEDLESNEEMDGEKWADLEDRLLINSASSAGGEILSEMFTAGLGGGITKMAKKFGPKIAKKVMANAGSKLAFAFTGEGASEVAADAWSRLGDYAIVGDKEAFKGAAREFGKTFLIGGAIGGGIGIADIGNSRGPAVEEAVVRKIQPKQIKESQKKAQGRVNALWVGLKEAQERGDGDVVVNAIKDQIKLEQSKIIRSNRKVHDQLRNQSPDQVKELNDRDDKIAEIEEAFKNPELDDATFETLTNKYERLKEEQAQIFTNPDITDARKAEPVNQGNRKISQEIQSVYEGKEPGYQTVVADKMSGHVANLARNAYYKVDKSKRQLPLEDLISKIKYSKGGVVDLIKTYNPEKNKSLAAYINTNLPKRINRIIKEVTYQEAPASLDAGSSTFVSDVSKKTPRELVDNLNLPQSVLDDSVEQVERLELLVKDGVTPKDYGKIQKKFYKDRIFPKLKALVKKPEHFKKFLKSQPEAIADLYLNSADLSKIRTGLQATWNTVPPSRIEFQEYFLGRDLDLSTAKGKNNLNSRKDKLINAVADNIGQRAWQDHVDANPKILDRIAKIKENRIKQTVKEIIPNSEMNSKFQETQDISETDFEAQSKATNKALKDAGHPPMPDSRDSNDTVRMQDWVGETMSSYFPRSFFNSGNFWNAGKSAGKRGFFYETEAQFDELTAESNFNKTDEKIFNKVQRYHYRKFDADKLIKDKDVLEQRGKDNQKAFNRMWEIFDQMIADDSGNAPMIAAFLKSSQNSQNHLSRLGAPLVAYSDKGPYTEEHAMPQSAVSRYLLDTILNKGSIKESLDNTNKNFVQVALNHTDDTSLKSNKIGPGGKGLNSNMPAGWKPTDNWLARYFNTTSKIDPDSITFINTGLTVTQTYAPTVKESRMLPPGYVAVGNTVVKQVVADKAADRTPHDIQRALNFSYKETFEAPVSDTQAFEAVNDILNASWKKHDIQTVSKQEMLDFMTEKGIENYDIDAVNGVSFGNKIYINPETVNAETPIHEFGHVWTNHMSVHYPDVFNAIYEKLRTEAPAAFNAIEVNMDHAGYTYEEGSHDYKDEVIAQAIGAHGNKLFRTPKEKAVRKSLLRQFYDKIRESLGLPVGTDMLNMNVEQMMDAVVKEVMEAAPGSQFGTVRNANWYKIKENKRAPAKKATRDPQFVALQAVKDNYRQTKDLDAALDAGYQTLGKNYDLDTWLKFAKGAITPVANNTALSIIKGEVLEANNATLDKVKQSQEEVTEVTDLAEELAQQKAPRKPNSFFLTPRAEDFEGLIYTLLPKGKKGEAMKEKFKKFLIDPYWKGVQNLNERHNQTLKSWRAGTKGLKLNEKLPGMDYTAGDAIKVAAMEAQGVDSNIDPQEKAELLAYADGELGNVMELFNTLGIEITPEDLSSRDPISKTLNREIVKKMRNEELTAFNKNLKALGLDPSDKNSPVWKQLEAQYGQDYAGAFKGILRRMKSGKNRLSSQPVNPILKWLGVATSTTMFWNKRSAVLQMTSAFNFLGLPNNNIFQATAAVANAPQFISDIKFLWNSNYLQDRRGGAKFDVLADEIAGEEGDAWMSRTINKIFTGKFGGFAPTRLADSFAIASGGAAFYRNTINALVKQGVDPKDAQKQAYAQWANNSETTQQSADPAKISDIQADELGKIFFAFANTPFQYARYAKRKIQDVATGRSKNPRKDIQTALYFTVGQTVMFNGLQTGLVALAMSDDDDDALGDKALLTVERSITGLIKPLGYGGAATAATLQALAELYKQRELGYGSKDNKSKRSQRVADAFLAISPVLSVKFRGAKKAAEKLEIGDRIGAATEAGQFLTGLPFAKLMNDVSNIKEALEIENDAMEKWARIAGWSKWDFVNFGLDDFDKIDFDFNKEFRDIDNEFKAIDREFNSAFDRGETGQAFKDGTIEVDPNLSPEEREKTIAHEQQHVKDMKENGLDYDDQNVYWKGAAFKRKNGQINYNGKWMPEGDRSFPWEAHAYEAESPIARVDDKDKKKEDEKYIRNPEHIEQVNKSRDRFEQHYSDPVTEELYRQNTGFSDLPSKVDTALNTRIQTGFVPQGSKATYDPAIGEYKGAITVGDYRDPAVVDHELTHAAGFDEALGKEAQKILGKPKSGDKYLSKPSELYGNLHEFRARLDLKGFERNLSPKKVQDLIKFNELENDPDIKQMIDEFGLDKLSEALNKIASNKKKPTLEGLYG